jgi:hypothetical protein
VTSVGVSPSRESWIPSFFRLCNNFFSFFVSLFYLCLSYSTLVSGRILRYFLFSAIFCFTIIGHSSLEIYSFLFGVACHAAFLIPFIIFLSASSISISSLRLSPRLFVQQEFPLKNSRWSFLLYKNGFFDFPCM